MINYTTDFQTALSKNAIRIEEVLRHWLKKGSASRKLICPQQLFSAMCHGTLGGGKRLRPFILAETVSMLHGDRQRAFNAGAALECVHCYSLIHDDLPAMDNDDLRRGMPTVHRAYDEATAILAGNSLLSLAFTILCDESTHPKSDVRLALIKGLAKASGMMGITGGQMLDLTMGDQKKSRESVTQMQVMKTGVLIAYACEAGAILAGASDWERQQLLEFGMLSGRLFQLADDILDLTASEHRLGKRTSKDHSVGKITMVDFLGLDQAQSMARELMQQAQAALESFGERANMLLATARYIVERNH